MNRAPNVVSLDAQRIREPLTLDGSASSAPSSLLLFGLCVLLCYGPLAFGAVEDWAVFGLEAGVCLLVFAWTATQVFADRPIVRRSPLFWPALAFACLVAAQLVFHTTIYPYETKYELLEYLAYAGVLFLAVQILHREALRTFAEVMTGFGFLVAVLAIAQDLSSGGKLYWVRTPSHGGWIFGPYVNHNHYAGLMEMLIPFALMLVVPGMLRGGGHRMLAGFAAVMMIASLFLSRSRGGMAGFAVEIILLALYLAPKVRLERRGLWSLGVALVLAAAMVVWLGLDAVIARTLMTGRDVRADIDVGRLRIVHDSLPMFRQRPWLGWGLGNFPLGFPAFRTFTADVFVNAAHDEYLQVLIETGLFGFGVMLWGLAALARRGLELWQREFDRFTALRMAALAGVVGLLVHNLVDFNLHIPANAALFFALCGIVTSSSRTNVVPLSSRAGRSDALVPTDIQA